MRHITLLASSLLAVAGAAQDYLANDPVWLVTSVCAVPAPCIANDTYNYYTAGDSVINGTTWTKVLRQGSYTLSWQSPNPPDPNCQGLHPYGPAYYGVQLIRQEGRQLRILNGTDQLLHEFDLVVGSTLPLSFTNWTTDITVLAVDSVLIGTEMRARYELANSWAPYLIEGVGSSHGLFEPVSDFFDCGYGLDCFGLGTEAFFPPNSGGSTCWLAMAMDEAHALAEWTLAPNPADNMVMITTNAIASTEVVVRDMSGRVVLQDRLTSMPKASLDVSGLPNGCYVLSIGDAVPKRLVVTH